MERFGRSTGGASSLLSMTMLPWKSKRRSISAAAKPAAPPPTITILCGASPARLPRDSGFGCFRFSLTKILPSRCSTDQHATGLKAGARKASPVRRSKQA